MSSSNLVHWMKADRTGTTCGAMSGSLAQVPEKVTCPGCRDALGLLPMPPNLPDSPAMGQEVPRDEHPGASWVPSQPLGAPLEDITPKHQGASESILQAFIADLYLGTRSGAVTWEPSEYPQKGCFSCSLGGQKVSLAREVSTSPVSFSYNGSPLPGIEGAVPWALQEVLLLLWWEVTGTGLHAAWSTLGERVTSLESPPVEQAEAAAVAPEALEPPKNPAGRSTPPNMPWEEK